LWAKSFRDGRFHGLALVAALPPCVRTLSAVSEKGGGNEPQRRNGRRDDISVTNGSGPKPTERRFVFGWWPRRAVWHPAAGRQRQHRFPCKANRPEPDNCRLVQLRNCVDFACSVGIARRSSRGRQPQPRSYNAQLSRNAHEITSRFCLPSPSSGDVVRLLSCYLDSAYIGITSPRSGEVGRGSGRVGRSRTRAFVVRFCGNQALSGPESPTLPEGE
jgi:hypothetical protein